MKIKAEIYGDQIGVDNNITKAFKKKEFQILLSLRGNENRERYQIILNSKDARTIIKQANTLMKENPSKKNEMMLAIKRNRNSHVIAFTYSEMKDLTEQVGSILNDGKWKELGFKII